MAKKKFLGDFHGADVMWLRIGDIGHHRDDAQEDHLIVQRPPQNVRVGEFEQMEQEEENANIDNSDDEEE